MRVIVHNGGGDSDGHFSFYEYDNYHYPSITLSNGYNPCNPVVKSIVNSNLASWVNDVDPNGSCVFYTLDGEDCATSQTARNNGYIGDIIICQNNNQVFDEQSKLAADLEANLIKGDILKVDLETNTCCINFDFCGSMNKFTEALKSISRSNFDGVCRVAITFLAVPLEYTWAAHSNPRVFPHVTEDIVKRYVRIKTTNQTY